MLIRWLVVAVVLSYVVMLFGGAALKPGYSHVSQFISELNASGTPHATTIGWLGFLPFGVLAGALLAATSRHASVRGPSRIGFWLLVAEPLAYIGSVFAPCDLGCPAEGSPSQMLHNLLGLFTYLATSVGLFLLALTPSIATRLRLFWVALSLLWLTLFVLMVSEPMADWRGLLQRLAEWIAYPSLLVCAWRVSDAHDAVDPMRRRHTG